MKESELILSVGGLPPMSARGCKQSLFPINSGEVLRDINGDLVHLGDSAYKYRSIITGKDINSIALDNICIGTQIQVGCIQMLWVSVENGVQEVRMKRPVVNGSVIAINSAGDKLEIERVDGTLIRLSAPTSEKSFVAFRPWLTMRILNFVVQTDECENMSAWKIILEEV